jgi:hypothetical protein
VHCCPVVVPPTPEARIPDGTGRTPEVVPHPGPRTRIFVDQYENRDLISEASFLASGVREARHFRFFASPFGFCANFASEVRPRFSSWFTMRCCGPGWGTTSGVLPAPSGIRGKPRRWHKVDTAPAGSQSVYNSRIIENPLLLALVGETLVDGVPLEC